MIAVTMTGVATMIVVVVTVVDVLMMRDVVISVKGIDKSGR